MNHHLARCYHHHHLVIDANHPMFVVQYHDEMFEVDL
jgi:hypothetical protein